MSVENKEFMRRYIDNWYYWQNNVFCKFSALLILGTFSERVFDFVNFAYDNSTANSLKVYMLSKDSIIIETKLDGVMKFNTVEQLIEHFQEYLI